MSEWLKAKIITNKKLEISDGRKCGISGVEVGDIVDVQIIDDNHPRRKIYLRNTKPGEILFCKQTNNYILDKHIELINKALYKGVEL